MTTFNDSPAAGTPSIARTKGFQSGYAGKSMRRDHTRPADALMSILVSRRCIAPRGADGIVNLIRRMFQLFHWPRRDIMRIGILGSGLMGAKLGTIFARAGHDVTFSYARSEEKLKRLARKAGRKARAGTPREAARDADAVLLAVPWLRIDDVLAQAGDLSGKVVITCSMPMNDDDTELAVAHISSGPEELTKRIPGARVVAAFGTVPSEVLFPVYAARRKASRPSLAYCGDDRKAKNVAA